MGRVVNSESISMHRPNTLLLIIISLFILTLLACQVGPTPMPPTETPALATATLAAETTEAPDPTPTATSEPPIYVYQPNPDLPLALSELVAQQALAQTQGAANESAYTFEFGDANPVGNWVYALVAPFPTVPDEVNASWLQKLWRGQPEDAIQTLLVAEGDLPALINILGQPGQTVQTQAKETLLETAWTTQNTWAIIPFEEIQPRWKVLVIDGQSPI
ncbi:MAG: hypothetical protein KBA05_06880, partial [Anaerolineaceae bacterium]|nr:hypothetical protein [Anaerolineaceae bacterium]